MENERWVSLYDLSDSRKYALLRTHAARVLYVLLLHRADVWGRGRADVLKLWKGCWCTLGAQDELEALLEDLDAVGLIQVYQDAAGEPFFWITNWENKAGKHFRRRGPSRFPEPPPLSDHSREVRITPDDSRSGPDQSASEKIKNRVEPPLSPPTGGPECARVRDAHGEDPEARTARRRRDRPAGAREPQEWRHLLAEFPTLDHFEFGRAMDEYMAHRAEHESGKPYTLPALRRQLAELAELGPVRATALIGRVVAANWLRLQDHDARAQAPAQSARAAGANGVPSAAETRAMLDRMDAEAKAHTPPPPGTLMRLFEEELRRTREQNGAA